MKVVRLLHRLKQARRDGPLLRALRRGSWVLLDELNLAPQPVLEALNAVLDHRGTLYVPELGEAVAKGRGFRLFATQNPHGGVSGRRALPKSFLDRFFRVHVAALTLVDFEAVAYQKYALDEGFARECAACVDRIRREGVMGSIRIPSEATIVDRMHSNRVTGCQF